MNRKLLISIILSIVINIILLSFIMEKNKINIFSTNISSEDLVVNNFTLVSFNKTIYVQSGFTFKVLNEIDKIDSIEFEASIDGVTLLQLSINDHYPEKSDLTNSIYGLEKVKDFNEDSVLKIKLKYTINSEGREFHDNIKIKSIKKNESSI
ncbi:hypothetical protein [Clostridium sp.]|uniref:hypothetical protein n=1 Tax=Clostridium sp. TaxID=1506 RepID=UPI003F33563A